MTVAELIAALADFDDDVVVTIPGAPDTDGFTGELEIVSGVRIGSGTLGGKPYVTIDGY